MKVKELIEELLKFNLDADVYVHTSYNESDRFTLSYTSLDEDGGVEDAECVFIGCLID